MKIVNFKSGLGNQIFYYLLVRFLCDKISTNEVFGYYNPKYLKWHNGLEIQDVLDVNLPPATAWSDFVVFFVRILSKIPVFKILKSDDKKFSLKSIYYDGYWQDKKYFLDNVNKLKYKNVYLNEQNSMLLEKIMDTFSVSIHVRRGDYLTPVNKQIYGNICTKDYYQNAIREISNKMKEPHFFVFSNDLEWAKANFKFKEVTFVSNNNGKDSWIDMYLMSHCKANIIANSTFSYWGAMFNKNGDKIVIYPQKWSNIHKPDIFPDEWIGI